MGLGSVGLAVLEKKKGKKKVDNFPFNRSIGQNGKLQQKGLCRPVCPSEVRQNKMRKKKENNGDNDNKEAT